MHVRAIISVFIFSVLLQSGMVSLLTVCSIRRHRAEIKAIMKKELREGLHEDDLVSFSDGQLKDARWEHEREFSLGNARYDVVRVQSENGQRVFVCIPDSREAALYKELERNHRRDNILEQLSRKFSIVQHTDMQLPLFPGSQPVEVPVFQDMHGHLPYERLFRPPLFT